jgi:hypothetical protein
MHASGDGDRQHMTLKQSIASSVAATVFLVFASASVHAQQPTLSASVNGTLVSVQWTPVPGAQQYDVEVTGTLSGALTVGAQPTAYTLNAPPGTFTLRVRARAGNLQGPFSNAVTVTVGSAAPGPSPTPVPPPTGNRTPDPPPGTVLPLPAYGPSVVQALAAQFPGALRNSCGNHEWLLRLVYQLRQIDTRWGLNWKRGNIGDMSEDVVTYHFGPGPDENSTNVYIIDVIGGHCGGNPGPNWQDQTRATRDAGTIGRWTLRPLLPYIQ